jgi:hypothetical protein
MSLSQQVNTILNTAISGFVIVGVAVVMARVILGNPIPWDKKRELIQKYGLWAVNRAEAFCPENDVACVEREAKRLIEVYKYRRGL